MEIVTLTTGVQVKCRPVPPYMRMDVYTADTPPLFPREKLKSVTGATEERDMLAGNPEVEAWREATAAYQRRVSQRLEDFTIDYGIVAWRWDEESEWENEPLDTWIAPTNILAKYGVTRERDPRVLFIMSEIITTDLDKDRLDAILIGELAPVLGKEVEAALLPFD